MQEILVQPEDLWSYYHEHKSTMQYVPEVIASDDSLGVEVLLSAYGEYATVTVLVDNETVFEQDIFSSDEAEEVAREAYAFLEDDGDEVSEMLAIDDRETELDQAVYDLLEVVVQDAETLIPAEMRDEAYERIKDLVCETLYKEFGVSVYRPMYLEDDDGVTSYEEFPYEEMDFDD